MTKNPKEERSPDEAGSSDYKATADEHIDKATGSRVPTPDPKDQTGDPDEANPAMRELHERQARRDVREG